MKILALILVIPAPLAFVANFDTKLGDFRLGEVVGFAFLLILMGVGIVGLNEKEEKQKEDSSK